MSGLLSRGRRLRGAAAAVGVAAAVLLAGCSSAGQSEGDGQTLVIQSLSFMGPQTEAIVDAFKAANPGVEVEVASITGSQLDTNGTVLSSSNPPDVGFVPINRTIFSQLTGADQLEPLTDVWAEADLENRYGSTVAAALKGGGDTPHVVAIDGIFYSVVAYNKTAFAELGIPEPADHRFASFTELSDAVAKLKTGGYEGIAAAGASTYAMANFIDPLLPTAATPEQMSGYLSGWNPAVPETAKYTDPAFVGVLNQVKAMNDGGFFQNGFLGATDDQAKATFAAGTAGMFMATNSDVLSLTGTTGFDIGWALMPPMTAGSTTQLDSFMDTLGIPVNAKNKDLAKKFLAFYMTQESQAAILAAGVNLPVVNDLPAGTESTDANVNAMLADVSTNGLQLGWANTVPGAMGQGFVNPLIQKMFLGQTTPDAIAADVQSAYEKVRAGNG